MLGAPSVKGHLKVTVEHGRLHYALWERDAAPKGVGTLAGPGAYRAVVAKRFLRTPRSGRPASCTRLGIGPPATPPSTRIPYIEH
jgi:hypothetical protein